MIKKLVVGVLGILFLTVASCDNDKSEKETVKPQKKVKKKTDDYQQKLRKNKVKSIKAIAVQYKFGEPSDERFLLYQTNYNDKGYLVDSITFRNNARVAKESIEYGVDNEIVKRTLYDSSGVLVSLLERELNKNGDEISFKSYLRDTLRHSQEKGYNDKNKLVKITDYYNDGSVKTISKYTYNSKGKVITKIELNDIGSELYKQTIGYDSKVSLFAKYEFEYNTDGEETKKTIYNGMNQILRQSFTKYDEKGNRVSFKLYEGEVGLRGSDIFKYNDKGLEVEIKTLDNQNQLKFKKTKEYNDKGLLIKEVNYNHLDEPEFEFIYEYTYYE